MSPAWTSHARARFAERFPEVDPDLEWASALTSSGRIGRKLKRRIKKQCPAHVHQLGVSFRGRYYRLGRSNCVFVVTPPRTIVTVFPLSS